MEVPLENTAPLTDYGMCFVRNALEFHYDFCIAAARRNGGYYENFNIKWFAKNKW